MTQNQYLVPQLEAMMSRLRALAAPPLVLALLLVGGCSHSDPLPYTIPVQDAPGFDPDSLPPSDRGVSNAPAGSAAEAGPASGYSADAGPAAVVSTTSESDRQVIQTGFIELTSKDPVATSARVVALVEQQGPETRIEERWEQTYDGWSSASLVVRVPAGSVDAVVEGLSDLGTVSSVQISSEDVTGTVEDLDARITAQQISVERMEDVLSRAQTTSDVVAAEDALRQRQSDLEQMLSERSRLADQVALSSLSITISEPSVVAAEDPTTFTDAVAAGWASMTKAARTAVLVIGVLLPWLGLLTLVVLAVVWPARRALRRRRARRLMQTTPTDSPTPVGPTTSVESAELPAAEENLEPDAQPTTTREL